MPKLSTKLRDLHTLRLEVQAEIHQLQIDNPEQLAALCVEAFEDGFTLGMDRRRRAPKGGIKAKPPKGKRRKKPGPKPRKKADPKRAARNLQERTKRAIVKVLGNRSLTRGQIAEQSGIDPEMVSACLHKAKGTTFVETKGHRWKVNPKNPTKGKGRNGQPLFKNVVAKAMGKRTMSAPEVAEMLAAKGLMPESKRPAHYVSVTLTTASDTFERVEKGRYRVIQ
jgi:hypothetical protein